MSDSLLSPLPPHHLPGSGACLLSLTLHKGKFKFYRKMYFCLGQSLGSPLQLWAPLMAFRLTFACSMNLKLFNCLLAITWAYQVTQYFCWSNNLYNNTVGIMNLFATYMVLTNFVSLYILLGKAHLMFNHLKSFVTSCNCNSKFTGCSYLWTGFSDHWSSIWKYSVWSIIYLFSILAATKLNIYDVYRRMSTEEKKKLSTALTSLSPEDLDNALLIVSHDYPNFHATSREVDLDIDSLVIFSLV